LRASIRSARDSPSPSPPRWPRCASAAIGVIIVAASMKPINALRIEITPCSPGGHAPPGREAVFADSRMSGC
jgi:hypothetical protein